MKMKNPSDGIKAENRPLSYSAEIDIDIVDSNSKGNGKYFEMNYILNRATRYMNYCKKSIIQKKTKCYYNHLTLRLCSF